MSRVDHPSRGKRHECGSASIEMVVILPVLLLLVFGIAEFGLAFGRSQLVVNAAHEGARVAALSRANCRTGPVGDLARARARAAVAGLGIAPTDVDPRVTGQCVPGGDVTVTVRYVHEFPLVSALAGGSIPASLPLTGVAVRANEIPDHN